MQRLSDVDGTFSLSACVRTLTGSRGMREATVRRRNRKHTDKGGKAGNSNFAEVSSHKGGPVKRSLLQTCTVVGLAFLLAGCATPKAGSAHAKTPSPAVSPSSSVTASPTSVPPPPATGWEDGAASSTSASSPLSGAAGGTSKKPAAAPAAGVMKPVPSVLPTTHPAPATKKPIGGNPSTWAPVFLSPAAAGQTIPLLVGQTALLDGYPTDNAQYLITLRSSNAKVVSVAPAKASNGVVTVPGMTAKGPGTALITVYDTDPVKNPGAAVIGTYTIAVN